MSKTIVLDLDECLLHTFIDEKMDVYDSLINEASSPDLESRLFKIFVSGNWYWGVKRPHLDDFLEYCYKTFDNVCVWSAGSKPYVKAIVEEVFKSYEKPKIIMTRNDILYEGSGYCKPLSFLFEKVNSANKYNTIMLDDKEDNFVYNIGNGYTIGMYNPSANLDSMTEEDDELKDHIKFFSMMILRESLMT